MLQTKSFKVIFDKYLSDCGLLHLWRFCLPILKDSANLQCLHFADVVIVITAIFQF